MIEIIKDDLTKETWEFYLLNGTLFLNEYRLLKRESATKRKYRVLKKYSRLMKRESSIEESEVPLTNEVKELAVNSYIKTIDCRKWSER